MPAAPTAYAARASAVGHDDPMSSAIGDALRLPSGPVDLTAIETDAAPCFDGGKSDGKAALAEMGAELADLQERLWAERTAGSERRVLLVLQGMDTSGKGGVLRHTIGLVDPQGVRITSFSGSLVATAVYTVWGRPTADGPRRVSDATRPASTSLRRWGRIVLACKLRRVASSRTATGRPERRRYR